MTAMHAELHPFRLALRNPLVTGGVSIRFRAGFLVSLHADGLTGWGEASPLPGWSRNTLLETEAALRSEHGRTRCSSRRGVDYRHRLRHPCRMRRMPGPDCRGCVGRHLKPNEPGGRLQPISLEAWATGQLPPPAVSVNALVAVVEPSHVEQAVRQAARAGFGAVKLKVGSADPAVDVERIQAARAALGRGAELRLDANGAWDQATALDVLDRVNDCDIAYCEEPVAGIEAIAAVDQRSPIPVAADESIRSEADAVRALDLGVGTLIVKPQALGGPDVALDIAARAHEAEASVVVTSFMDSAVGVAHALHVAAAADAAAPRRRAHGLATAELLAADVAEAPPVVAGAMAVPAAAGLGLVPEAEASSSAP